MPIQTVRIWINAFIPGDIGSGYTIEKGPHAGKTMIHAPGPLTACFLTDQRGFSSDPDAHSRMHSAVEIDVAKRQMTDEHHHCHPTIQIDCMSGEVECEEEGSTENMQFSEFKAEGNILSVKLEAASKNPCIKVAGIKVSPNVDYTGTLSLELSPDGERATLIFDGRLEPYPCFEMYASVNGGAPITVFQEDLKPNPSVISTLGAAKDPIRREVTLTS